MLRILTVSFVLLLFFNISSVGQATYVKPSIVSFEITPSKRIGSWTLYQPRALAIFKGNDLRSVEVREMPTGTDMGGTYPNGISLGFMTQTQTTADGDEWAMVMPMSLSSTNFWVVLRTKSGKVIKGPDLGHVGQED